MAQITPMFDDLLNAHADASFYYLTRLIKIIHPVRNETDACVDMRYENLNHGGMTQHVGARARGGRLKALCGRREGRPPRPQRGGGAGGPTVGRARARARARALSTRNVTFSFMRPSNMQNLSAGAAHTADL